MPRPADHKGSMKEVLTSHHLFPSRRRGTIVTAFIICYALTSFVAGYVSGGFYSRSDGKHWIKSMLLTASLFPFASFGIGFMLNTVAIFYHSLAAIPFGTMVRPALLEWSWR